MRCPELSRTDSFGTPVASSRSRPVPDTFKRNVITWMSLQPEVDADGQQRPVQRESSSQLSRSNAVVIPAISLRPKLSRERR